MKKLYFLALFILLSSGVFAQSIVKGIVKASDSGQALEGILVTIQDTKISARTDEKGRFKLYKVYNRSIVLVIEAKDYQPFTQSIEIKEKMVNVGELTLAKPEKSAAASSGETIQVISLDDADASESSEDQNVASQIGSSRDLFYQMTSYNWGALRFNQRGYASNYTEQYFNGVPFNELDDDRIAFNSYGGLNDVTRLKQNYIGLEPTNFAFGDLSGSMNVDTRASMQRKQTRVSYMNANSNFTHRLMGTYSTGLLPNGWALTASASRRWAQEIYYVRGAFMDAYSLFLSVDKKLNTKHLFNVTAFSAPIKQGRTGPTIYEMRELSGEEFYNPYWGYQDGKKRNARVQKTNSPTVILRHDYTPNRATTLTTSASFQYELFNQSDLDWFSASNPFPDYYSKLPSSIDDDKQKAELTAFMKANESARQINWTDLYNTNRGGKELLENATVNGVTGQTKDGLRSKYVLFDRVNNSREVNIYSNIQHQLSDNQQLVGGVSLRYFKGENYKKLTDLLGGEYFVDVDNFAERTFPGTSFGQNDLRTPNRVVTVGDQYGYDYNINVRNAFAWGQWSYNGKRIDLFAAAKGAYNDFWREGFAQNGRFPDNSLGKSDLASFFNYGTKAGATYKLNGRNYFHIYGGYMTKAPNSRDAFLSPRTRNELASGLKNEKITTVEAGYNYRSPRFSAQAKGYLTIFEDKVKSLSFFSDEDQSFVNFVAKGLGYRHTGIELAAEWKPFSQLEIYTAGTIGQHLYNSRPTATATPDNGVTSVQSNINGQTIYIKGYYVPNTPQMAGTFGFRYTAKRFWFNGNFNYFAKRYMDMNFNRRTEYGISTDLNGADKLIKDSRDWNNVIDQTLLPDAYTVNALAGTSFYMKKHFISITAGSSNVMNSQFTSAAFEQWRFSWADKNVNKFPPRYFVSYGRTYFVMLAFRLKS
jgi:hypothetical protein